MILFFQTLLNGVMVGSGYALAAVGLTLVFGILGIVNFAHGAYFALGAYSVLLAIDFGVPYIPAVGVGVLIVLAVALVTEVVIVRRGLYGEGNQSSLIVTFALAQALMALLLLLAGPDPQPIRSPFGGAGVSLFGLVIASQRLFVAVVSTLVLAGFAWWLKHSVRGRQVTAVSQNPRGALYSGINVPRIRTLSFMAGVGAAGLAGGVIAPITSVFPTMGNTSLITSFVVVIVGGLGSISGSLLGAMLMGIANALFETYVSVSWTPALGWTLVILTLLVAPHGLRGRAIGHRY
jgi:branched-chain amino acid transport system permease protein